MVRFAVCDDEREVTEYISDRLREYYPEECEIKKYEDGENLLSDSRREVFDALFLDIDMPGLNGMELAKKIRECNEYVKIIFVTNKDNLVFSTFKYAPFRFIRKTCLEEEFPEMLAALRESIAQSNATIIFSTKSGDVCVQVSSIIYAEVMDHTITVHLLDGTLEISKSMDRLENELGKFGFLRTHKSYLANHKHIRLISQNKIFTDTNENFPLSRSYAKEVKIKLQQLSRKK